MRTSVEEQWRLLTDGAAEVVPPDAFRERLASGRPLRVKLGMDPTAPHVTLGWTVVLRRLRRFQDLGHQAVLILGDFTARIGDPSGQSKTRPMLEREQVQAYADRVLDQFGLVVDRSRLEVRYNSEWLEALDVPGLLRLASHYTVARMLERDDFSKRYADHTPISVTEFLYPLLQAYDSVAVSADVELGGTDQLFNLLAGREIQRAYGQEPQCVLTMPLLIGTDGHKKMSQSLGNYIGITEPPDDMFGKLMRVPDHLMGEYLRLVTDLDPDEVDALERGLKDGSERPEAVKRRLASEVVRLFHGPDPAAQARERFDRVIRDHELPRHVPDVPLPEEAVIDGRVNLPRLLKAAGLVPSSAEGRRKVEQRGVRIDGEVVTELEVPPEAVRGRILQVGRHTFVRIV